MTFDMAVVFAVLGGAVALFLSGRVRLDITALLVIAVLSLSGILTPAQAVAGFGNPLVILIAGLFVIGEGLYRTGVASAVGRAILAMGGGSEGRIILLLMPSVAVLSAFMSSTGAVAIFIPIVISMGREAGVSASRLLMPLAIAALIGGMLTLIGTPPNIAVSTALQQAGLQGFAFFDFSPIGAVILVAGVLYVLTLGRRLLPDRGQVQQGERKTLRELANFFGIKEDLHRLRVEPGSPLAGSTVGAIGLRRQYAITVIAIERQGKLVSTLHPVLSETVLQAGDLLIGYGPKDRVGASCEQLSLMNQGFPDGLQRRFEKQFGAAECLIPPGSPLIGKTVLEADFRRRLQMSVLSIRRGSDIISLDFSNTALEAGDMILLTGPWSGIEDLMVPRSDLVLLEVAKEQQDRIVHPNRAFIAVAIVGAMLGLMTFNVTPAVVAILLAALAMVATQCVTMDEAYRSMNWQSLILIAGMLPLSTALETTGGAALISGQLVALSAQMGPLALLAGLFVLTSVFSQFISNTATTILLAPIALGTAADIGLSPEPLLMGVAIAASTAFATPIASPVNTLVLGPGRYNFMDFAKVGIPLQVIALALSLVLIPFFFPFSP